MPEAVSVSESESESASTLRGLAARLATDVQKIGLVVAGTLLAGLVGFLAYEHRREAKERRAAAIGVCLSFPFFDLASCEDLVDTGSVEERVQGEVQTRLVALQLEVSLARQACTELDTAIHYVGLRDRVLHRTSPSVQDQASLEVLTQGFACEDSAAKASMAFHHTQRALAEKQQAAAFEVTANGVTLPELDTPAIEALKAVTER